MQEIINQVRKEAERLYPKSDGNPNFIEKQGYTLEEFGMSED